MPGIVSIVEGAAGDHARRCWGLLARELELRATPPGAIPHVSYHVSDGPYRMPRLPGAIARAATGWQPFEMSSTGPGMFAGEPAVIYLTVTRTGTLSQLQQAISRAAEPHADGTADYWHQERWVPHISVANEGLTPDLTARAMSLLVPLARPLPVRIENLALLDELTGVHKLVRRWDFAGKVAEK